MEIKKNPRANLVNYTSLFLMMGLVLILFTSWRLIEYKKYDKDSFKDEKWNVQSDDLEETFQVEKEQPKPKEQIKKQVIPTPPKEVEDEEEVETPEYQDTSTDEEEAVDEPEDIETADETDEDVQVAFQFVEQPPIYPGCEKYKNKKAKLKECMTKKIQRFINRKFNKDIASDLGIEGVITVNVFFLVGKDGKVTQIQARSSYKELADEAKRVISQLPKMIPGEQRGRPVKVQYFLPIKFRVE